MSDTVNEIVLTFEKFYSSTRLYQMNPLQLTLLFFKCCKQESEEIVSPPNGGVIFYLKMTKDPLTTYKPSLVSCRYPLQISQSCM